MSIEDRKHQRSSIESEFCSESFHVEVYDRSYVLNRIHDVSISGTGIMIPTEIRPGTPVKLVFKSDDYIISVNGTTVWCKPISLGKAGMDEQGINGKEGYRTGIQFDYKDRNCAMFFMALKDFISKR